MRTIPPGESLTYRFTAERAGIWMYHCSTMPMSAHIANGMFGAVVIEPRRPRRRSTGATCSCSPSTTTATQGGAGRPGQAGGRATRRRGVQRLRQPVRRPATGRTRRGAGPRVGARRGAEPVDRPSTWSARQFDTVFAEGAYLLRPGQHRAVRRASPWPPPRAASWSCRSRSRATTPSSPTSWSTPSEAPTGCSPSGERSPPGTAGTLGPCRMRAGGAASREKTEGIPPCAHIDCSP